MCKLQCQNIKEIETAGETQCFYVFYFMVYSTWIEDFSWRNHLWSTLRSLATWPEENAIQNGKKSSSNATEVSLLFLYHACGLLPCGRNTGTCSSLVKPVFVSTGVGTVNIAVNLQLWRGEPG